MASKPKRTKTFVVHHRGRSNSGGCLTFGRYLVGAKNEEEAEAILREKVGKHSKVRVYYEEKKKLLPYREVIREC